MNMLKLKRNGCFYSAYDDDAYVISYIMNYKIIKTENNKYKVGFPDYMIDEVVYYLKKNKISFYIDDNIEKSIDYRENNRYLKCLKKDLPVYLSKKVLKKVYSGNFSVLFDDDLKPEKYEIGKTIDTDAEIVEKVANNNVNDIVILKSGVKFKIIEKNIR